MGVTNNSPTQKGFIGERGVCWGGDFWFICFVWACFCLICFESHVLLYLCLILESLGENMKLGGCRGEEDLRGVGREERL